MRGVAVLLALPILSLPTPARCELPGGPVAVAVTAGHGAGAGPAPAVARPTPAEPLPFEAAEPLPPADCQARAHTGTEPRDPGPWDAPAVDLRAELPALLPNAVAWAEAAAAEASAAGRPLDESETALARRLGVERPERVRVAAVAEMPWPADPALAAAARDAGLLGPATAGLTLDHAILVRRGCESPRLLAHELRHVHQVERAGSLAAFLAEYLGQIVAHGYHDAPFEAEARAWERVELRAAARP